jgi:hypothetical protein
VLGSTEGVEAFQQVVEEYALARSFVPYVFEGSSEGADLHGIDVIGENA